MILFLCDETNVIKEDNASSYVVNFTKNGEKTLCQKTSPDHIENAFSEKPRSSGQKNMFAVKNIVHRVVSRLQLSSSNSLSEQ